MGETMKISECVFNGHVFPETGAEYIECRRHGCGTIKVTWMDRIAFCSRGECAETMKRLQTEYDEAEKQDDLPV